MSEKKMNTEISLAFWRKNDGFLPTQAPTQISMDFAYDTGGRLELIAKTEFLIFKEPN